MLGVREKLHGDARSAGRHLTKDAREENEDGTLPLIDDMANDGSDKLKAETGAANEANMNAVPDENKSEEYTAESQAKDDAVSAEPQKEQEITESPKLSVTAESDVTENAAETKVTTKGRWLKKDTVVKKSAKYARNNRKDT